MKSPLFYAKILLFGEYGIIKDSKGLAIPFNAFRGALKTSDNLEGFSKKSNNNLRRFYQHIANLNSELVSFDLKTFEADLESGMYFDSSIPQGYGVGS